MRFNFWALRKAQNAPRCVLLGLDTSGKTTLLYMWHMGQLVTTIPTIGFNIETIHHAGKTIQMIDYGGCDRLAPFVRFYLDSMTGILFLHALNLDPTWIEESIILLKLHVNQVIEANGKYIWVMMTKQDLVPSEELPTKRPETYKLLKSVLDSFGSQIVWRIFDQGGLNAIEPSRSWPVFDDIAQVLSGQNSIPQALPTKQAYNEEQIREKIREAGLDDEPVDRFWDQFLAADLPQWNHRNHLRAGYLVLLKSAAVLEDFWTATEIFLNHVNRLRRARPDRFRNTAHRTMTTFWMYMLQHSIVSFRKANSRLPHENEFQSLLLWNPRLYDTSYWADYYNKTTIFTPGAKQHWRLPDKKALPVNLEGRAENESNTWQIYNSTTNSVRMSEKSSGAQMRFIRFAVSIVQYYLSSGERRGKVVAAGLSQLQKSIMQLRAPSAYLSMTIPPYSETQAYFWIQIVHATLTPFHRRYQSRTMSTADAARDQSASPISTLTYAQLMHVFPIDPTLWKQYYSVELWNSIQARISFVNPDLRQLPNVFPMPSSSIVAQRFIEVNNTLITLKARPKDDDVEGGIRPEVDDGRGPEEITMRIESILATLHRLSSRKESANAANEKECTTSYDQRIEFSSLDSLTSLLFILYRAMKETTDMSTGRVDVSNFVSAVLSYDNDEHSGQNDVVGSIEKHVDTNLRSSLGNKGISDEEMTNPVGTGMTKLMFYARMALASSNEQGLTRSGKPHVEDIKLDDMPTESKDQGSFVSMHGFRDFLVSLSVLIWEDLPFRYYRPETWNSLDAKVMMVLPDLRPLPL